MSTLSITKSYSDGTVLFESDLDAIRTSVETFLNTTKINDDNIQNDGITASSKLVDSSITAGKLGASSVTTAKIQDDAVTTAKIVDDAVTNDKIRDSAALSVLGRSTNSSGSVDDIAADTDDRVLVRESDEIKFSQVNTAMIEDAAITQAKRADLSEQLSSSSSDDLNISTSFSAVSNLSVTITTTGRPVFVGLQSDGSSNTAQIGSRDLSGDLGIYLRIKRGSTVISRVEIELDDPVDGISIPPGALWHIDTPSAGTYTYTVEFASRTSGATISSEGAQVYYCKLVAYEL